MKDKHQTTISEIRDTIIVNLCRQMRASGKYACLSEIACELSVMEMPVHFISYSYALKVYQQVFKFGRELSFSKRQDKSPLYQSFIRGCRTIRQQHPNLDKAEVVKRALLQRAPSLGISVCHIRRILRQHGFH